MPVIQSGFEGQTFEPDWRDVFLAIGMSKLNHFRTFLGLIRITLPLLSLMTFAVQELTHQAIASSSFSSPTGRETSRTDLAPDFSVAPTNTPKQSIAPPETLEASRFSHPADRISQAQASQRSLTVRQVRGRVSYSLGSEERPLQVGDRLSAGEGELITGKNSSVDLAVDNQMGLVEVLENTSLQIKTLSGSDDEDTETVFFVSRGQVRLSLRPIRPASSDLSQAKTPTDGTRELLLARVSSSEGKTLLDSGEVPLLAQRRSRRRNYPVRVQTPAGIAGVRGTAFGVNVGPDGKTGVEVIEGSVAGIAQDQEVIFQGSQAGAMLPGESPTQPSPWLSSEVAKLRIRSLVRTSPHTALVSGQVDPMDIVFLNNKPVKTDSEGKFKVAVALPQSHRLNFVVRGPAVRARHYGIVVP